jgi:transitional endoplasmic reticulum ATPase
VHPYERWIIRRYLANALRSSRFVRPPSADREIFPWIDSHSRLLGLPEPASGMLSSRRRLAIESPMHSPHWKAWRAEAVGRAREPAPHPSPLQKRLDWLAQACSLNSNQSRVLGLLARATRAPEVRCLVEAINDRFDTDGRDLHPFLETSSERAELSARGRLSELGLIEAQESPRLSPVVHRLLSLPRFERRRVSDLLLGEPARASLAWNDFEHLGDLRDLAARVVEGAGGLRGAARRGVNSLFYGPPGTGKSEFAKTLGARVGFSVQFAGRRARKTPSLTGASGSRRF